MRTSVGELRIKKKAHGCPFVKVGGQLGTAPRLLSFNGILSKLSSASGAIPMEMEAFLHCSLSPMRRMDFFPAHLLISLLLALLLLILSCSLPLMFVAGRAAPAQRTSFFPAHSLLTVLLFEISSLLKTLVVAPVIPGIVPLQLRTLI